MVADEDSALLFSFDAKITGTSYIVLTPTAANRTSNYGVLMAKALIMDEFEYRS